ncbi:hypothetical protein CONPUDRAFT_44378 [Coniophora puteana RWD-64-598 SS2]|uniref:Tetraspanin Tsp2 family n=1 Tax=Coniophora puteana (strain RWD-64-598) TaxID=741705 RepID=A0A5M3N815_CONPW|nr:uncharacterized protein CONPUDRAFT_44378 [Coniophora puteana RWD-64-598 SS2]EIW87456.1 hypothetical protein CONPUDRAFT_44378 [Coniophora puteana RWD-64-598 SS2]
MSTNLSLPFPQPSASGAHSFTDLNSNISHDGSSKNLASNYIPYKFSAFGSGPRRRKGGAKLLLEPDLPKQGGGRDAFRAGEARMPAEGDEDYDGVDGAVFWEGNTRRATKSRQRMRWNKFKWALFIANLCLSVYALGGLIVCILVWLDTFTNAEVIRVGNTPELVLSTIACVLGCITSVIGWAGILLNNRSFLAVYTFLLWICFAFLVAPGYVTYKKRAYALGSKLDLQWSRYLGAEGRLRIQNRLHCCGYFSPFAEATVSATCYARTVLPGCRAAYLTLERNALELWYALVFGLVPLHIAIILAGLLCSNHVTYRFGKGMMPKAYRLSPATMAVIMDNYAKQLAEQYGPDVASDIISRSRPDDLQTQTMISASDFQDLPTPRVPPSSI